MNTPVGLLDARGTRIGDARYAVNFAVWWDADPLCERLDGNGIGKWEWQSSTIVRVLTATGASANNGSKATPALSADILATGAKRSSGAPTTTLRCGSTRRQSQQPIASTR
jgi:rhamnogalacturonan endolyase